MQSGSVSLPLEFADNVPWRFHDLSRSRAVECPPAEGEVCLWLVTSEFRFASASNIGSWLSVAERKRARLYPNSSIGRRFSVARATLRLITSQMFACRPQDVRVEDAPNERIVVRDASGERGVSVDVSYSGIWIVIAVAPANVEIGLSVEAPGGHEAIAEAARLARARAERGEDGAASWHGLVLPMPGELRGVVAVDRPVASVQAFGWDRSGEGDGRGASR
ncbi:conserved hypothetical protein [Burkholderia sp. 8Y]|uniref:hypothetical protein n=1 Tax=Burkholderia sp. 8Y TaxID=2653133 RepID=UPI0012F0BE8F|nr:hypothetical protein [Burkholderia sp. 8Y]VXA95074.1 conserved hypothetical protein [Burkholderia sp. 8Y]